MRLAGRYKKSWIHIGYLCYQIIKNRPKSSNEFGLFWTCQDFQEYAPGFWTRELALHLDIYAASSLRKFELWKHFSFWHSSLKAQGLAGWLQVFLCGAVGQIFGHPHYGKSQSLWLLYRIGIRIIVFCKNFLLTPPWTFPIFMLELKKFQKIQFNHFLAMFY